MRALVLLGVCGVAALAADTAVVTLGSKVVQAQHIKSNFAGFSIEVASATKQLTINGALRRSYSNLMVSIQRSCIRGRPVGFPPATLRVEPSGETAAAEPPRLQRRSRAKHT